MEASSKFFHAGVSALGSYKNSPFITGHAPSNPFTTSNEGLKTEILDYEDNKWISAKDYPFSAPGNQFVS